MYGVEVNAWSETGKPILYWEGAGVEDKNGCHLRLFLRHKHVKDTPN